LCKALQVHSVTADNAICIFGRPSRSVGERSGPADNQVFDLSSVKDTEQALKFKRWGDFVRDPSVA
jgi:hypothetical protein